MPRAARFRESVGFRAWELGFRVKGLELRVQGFRDEGLQLYESHVARS